MTRADVLTLGAFAAYFTAQAALRTALGGGLEVDEGEMLVLARGWRWGYGPQFPLYNWLQAGAFALLGPTTLALTALKNLVLWMAAAGLYLGIRRVHAPPVALAGALSVALLPNVVWEFQRASSHSIALLAAVTWTIWAVFGVLHRGRMRDWAVLGLVVGLGGLSKANYWLVPICLALVLTARQRALPDLSGRISGRGMALSVAIAAGMVARPYLWMLSHPKLAAASNRKAFRSDFELPPGVEGLAEALVGTLAGLAPVLIAVWLLTRRSAGRAPEGLGWPGRLLVLAGALGLAFSSVAILATGSSEVQSRWLVPVYVMLAAGLMIGAARRASPAGLRRLGWVALAIGALTFTGMAVNRISAPGTGSIDFAPLAALADRVAPDVVLADYHLGGNLLLLRPGLTVLPQLPIGEAYPAGRVMVLFRGAKPRDIAGVFQARGLVAPDTEGLAVEGIALPYLRPTDARFPVTAVLLPGAAITPAP